MIVIRETQKEYRVIKKIYDHASENALSENFKELQIKQAISVIEQMRSIHD